LFPKTALPYIGLEPATAQKRLASGRYIMVEGVSLVLAQRSEFNSMIRANGSQVVSLLTKLREHTQTLSLSQNTASALTQ